MLTLKMVMDGTVKVQKKKTFPRFSQPYPSTYLFQSSACNFIRHNTIKSVCLSYQLSKVWRLVMSGEEYPRLRVREQKHEEVILPAQLDQHLIGLKYLSILDPLPLVSEHKEDFYQSVEVQKCYVPNVIVPKVPTSEVADQNDKNIDEDTVNIRASPIPRPRAVLSSPDNDLAIGNKNRVKDGRPLAPTKAKDARPLATTIKNTEQNRHWRCKVVASNDTKTDRTNTGNLKEVTNNKIEAPRKEMPATASLSRKRVVGTGKSSSS